MEFMGTFIQRNSSKLHLVLFCYFPVSSCNTGNGWSFGARIYKELLQS